MKRRSLYALPVLALLATVLPWAKTRAQALNKSIDLGNGVAATYWRVCWVGVNIDTTKITFVMRGYVDKPTWQGGKTAVSERTYTMDVPGGAGSMTWNQLVLAMAAYAQTQSDFSGSTGAT